MSANASTALQGQSSNVGPLGAAAVLTAVVAFGALGFALGQGVATTTTTAARPVAGPVIDETSMSGPRSAAQKGLGGAAIVSGVDARFASQYERWVAVQEAARHSAAIATIKDADASIVLPSGSKLVLTAQYQNWLKAQTMANGSDFPDLYQRSLRNQGVAYSGSDFAGQYANWLKVQAAAAAADFPDYFQRAAVNTGVVTYGGTDFAGQYEAWLKAQAAAAAASFPDYFQRHEAPVAGGSGGRSIRLAQ